MTDSLTDRGDYYTTPVGLIYVFNLIVGTGTLTMPKAFASAGWAISAVVVSALAFISYMTSTFVIESMSTANAVRKVKREAIQQQADEQTQPGSTQVSDGDTRWGESQDEISDERTSLLGASTDSANSDTVKYGLFAITERIEMGQMASMFFNKTGSTFFYITLIVYLYGDLAIYAAAVPKSLRDVACTYREIANISGGNQSAVNSTGVTDSDPCWASAQHINRGNAYRLFLAAFTLLLGPFTFFNVQKTKYLQILTSIMRWLAFLMMIILTIMYLAQGKGQGHPKVADISGVPSLFGTCVYSFMCHHSLPSLVTPIKRKGRIYSLFAADYTFILVFYCVLSFTGIFSFPSSCISDIYTLNFQPGGVHCNVSDIPAVTTKVFIQYYLALFPVFVLSTNFPIIAITLRNNLKTLFYRPGRSYRWSKDRLFFPLLALVPPIILAFITNNIQFLVNVTGSFAGSGVQYIVPASLVLLSRRAVHSGTLERYSNTQKHTSPFKHVNWVIFTFIWAVICIAFVFVNNVKNWINGKF